MSRQRGKIVNDERLNLEGSQMHIPFLGRVTAGANLADRDSRFAMFWRRKQGLIREHVRQTRCLEND